MLKKIVLSSLVFPLLMTSVSAKEKNTDDSLAAIYAGCTVKINSSAVMFFQCTDKAFTKALNKFKEKNPDATVYVKGRDMNNVKGYFVIAKSQISLDGRER